MSRTNRPKAYICEECGKVIMSKWVVKTCSKECYREHQRKVTHSGTIAPTTALEKTRRLPGTNPIKAFTPAGRHLYCSKESECSDWVAMRTSWANFSCEKCKHNEVRLPEISLEREDWVGL